ncbi:hypothetical protein D3C86_2158890 [compost metagenome]
MRRVERLTSSTPARDSISARCLLTAGVVMPSSRAAALRLPALARVEKKPRSAGRMALLIGGPLLNPG